MGLNIAILTVSDTRTPETDTSGNLLARRAVESGHAVTGRALLKDDRYLVRAMVSAWLVEDSVHAIVITGGTGLTARDVTVEAVRPLLDKEIDGFGELFRWLSYSDVGTSTIQSRALGGIANRKLVFCLPGSTRACELAWDKLLGPQFDIGNKPCNFAELIPRF
jgi:molybdenum cofactor biosynthesis protein B